MSSLSPALNPSGSLHSTLKPDTEFHLKTRAAGRILPILFFLLCLGFFIERGTYRAISHSTTGDFSTFYAASRCWLHGENAYSASTLKRELVSAGAPASIVQDQDVNVSVYLPSALMLGTPLAVLPWRMANPVWCLISLLAFGISIWLILRDLNVGPEAKWTIAALAVLFSPTYVGLFDGNPSVLSISCIVIAICLALRGRPWASGVLLGAALCFKPQIAFSGICVFILWRFWRPLIGAFAILCAAGTIGLLVASSFGTSWEWLQFERQNVAVSFAPGGTSDPSPSGPGAWQMLNGQTIASYAVHSTRLANVAVWAVCGSAHRHVSLFAEKGSFSEQMARHLIFRSHHADNHVSPLLRCPASASRHSAAD